MHKLFCILLTAVFPTLALADKSPVYIRETKLFREISMGKKNILINKKSFNIVYDNMGSVLKLNHNKKSKDFIFSKNLNDKSNLLYFKKKSGGQSLVGYNFRKLTRYYMDNPAKCDIKGFLENRIEALNSSELTENIKKMQIENLFDVKSCAGIDKSQFAEFKKILTIALSGKQSALKECYLNADAIEIFEKDSALFQNADDVYLKYMSLIREVSSGTSKLKLKCGMENSENNKVASFNENPLVISLNLVNQKFNLGIDDIQTAVDHELLHLGMQQFKTMKNPGCLDEGFVSLFDSVCSYKKNNGADVPPSSASIVKSCLNGVNPNLRMISDGLEDGGDSCFVACPVLASISNEVRDQGSESQRVTENIVAAAPVFTPVSDADIQTVATAPVSIVSGKTLASVQGDGEFHQIVPDAEFSNSLRAVASGMESNFLTADRVLTNALSTNTGKLVAAATVGSRAVASVGSAAASTSASPSLGPMTPTEIFVAKYLPSADDVQAKVDDPKLASMSYSQKEDYYKSLGAPSGSVKSSLATSGQPSGTSAATGSVAKASAATSAATVAPKAAKAASRGIASVGSVTPVAVPSASGEVENTDAPVVKTSPTAANGAPSRLDNPMIQRLAVLSTVNGNDYVAIASRYRTDATFRKQLNDRNIRIENSAGKPLWVSSSQPEKCFVDTSKNLKQVACR